MSDVNDKKVHVVYLFLDIEWNQAPDTTGLEGREPIQIGAVAADATMQKVKSFSKAIQLKLPELLNEETMKICHTTASNIMQGSYTELFQKLGRKISENKLHRYTADEIINLNYHIEKDYSRECKVCRHIGNVDEDGVCELCRKIEKFSQKVLYAKFFTVVKDEEVQGLPLPGDCVLVADDENSVQKKMMGNAKLIRTYAKNKRYIGKNVETKIWVGNYTTGQSFEELEEEAEGIPRIGILRADVDNLGQTFVGGFEEKYTTISRTAALV